MAISDEAVKDKTGKSWKEWFSVLDRLGAAKMKHSGIAALLYDELGCPGWWNQMVANQYEQARGLRKKHEMPDGYQVGASKTYNAPISALYRSFSDGRARSGWLEGDRMEITTKRRDRSIRARWGKTRVDANFYPKGPGKSMVSLGHNKLKDAREANRMKAFWKKALASLGKKINK